MNASEQPIIPASAGSERKRRVWIASATTWDVYNFRAGIIRALVTAGYEVTAFSPTDEFVPQILALGADHQPMNFHPQGMHPLREVKTLWGLWRILRRARPDLLLTYSPKINIYCALAACFSGVPVIANISGLGRAFLVGGWLKAVMLFLIAISARIPRFTFFQNQDDLEEFVGMHLLSRSRSGRVPGSGVDTTRFHPAKRRPSGGIFTFLCPGRVMWDKGSGEFVAAARMLKPKYPHVRWRFLGWVSWANPSAIDMQQVDAWVKEGVVEYEGPTDAMPEALGQADCVVQPSYREGVPRTLIEAAAMGLPVITTDAIGCRDALIDGVTGYKCPVKDAPALAASMERMLNLSPAARAEMGMAARRFAEETFDERIVIERYFAAIERVLGPALKQPTPS
jgi:glycosyltransferase involved in cell wall biosynthesis